MKTKKITDPSEIYNVLSKGSFKKVTITDGSNEQYTVINASNKDYTWMVYKDKDGKTHTWYYPSYEDIKNGMIKSIEII